MRGTGVYTQNLIDALSRYEKGHTYSYFSRIEDVSPHADVVHYPFFDPFFITLPLRKPKPTVVTVHDMIPLVFPDKFPAGVRGSIKWWIQKRSLSGARAVITDSRASAADIVRIMGKPAGWVHTVPLAPDPKYRPVKSRSTLDEVRKRYRIPDRYILYVGDVNWNKNVLGLLTAWKIALGNPDIRRRFSLVLAGSAFTDTEIEQTRDIIHQIEASGLAKNVLRPGFIRNEDMAAVYSAAACVVLPSWYEGFGFPVLEAMSCGTPVVCTNRGSVPEISGPAISGDPGDEKQFAGLIVKALTLSLGERQALVKAGFTWKQSFSWERVAHETVAVYEEARSRAPHI